MTITKNVSFSITGKGKLKIGDETYQWSKGWLDGIDIWSGNAAKTFTSTITLKSEDWNMSFIRVTGDANMKVKLTDQTTGDGGSIEHLILGNAGSNITLNRTWVDFIKAYDDGVDVVKLGLAGAGRISLGRGNDTLTLGSGYVETIQMGDGHDQVNGGSGGGELVSLGQGNNTFTGGEGRHNVILAWDGDDTVTLGDGGAGAVDLGGGNDIVTVNDGGVDTVMLGDGNNTLVLAGTGWVGAVLAYDGNDTVTITGSAEFIGSIKLGGGNNVVTTGAGFVDSITTNGGNDQYNIGPGGVGLITSWGGEDTVTSSGWIGALLLGNDDNTVTFTAGGMAPTVNLRGGDDTLAVAEIDDPDAVCMFNGGDGVDTISFAAFTTELTLSLASSEASDSGAGIFILHGFENLTGGTDDDVLTGNDVANILIGGAGDDRLTGEGGDDTLTGGAEADTFVYAGSGDDTVTDFSIVEGDEIDLSGLAGVTDFTDLVTNHLTQGVTGAEITNGNGDVLILTGIDKNDLTSAQFVF